MNSSNCRILFFVFAIGLSTANSVFSQKISSISSDNDLLKAGYLDVTLFGADPTGKKISTNAIREAVKAARNNDLVCFFPSGTYLVDDTIRCMKSSFLRNGVWVTSNEVNQLVGDPQERPLIKIVPGAKNFQNPENPMPVFWLYAMSAWGQQSDCEGNQDPLCGQSNVSFNQVVMNIDFDLGGNPGAVAIRNPGAQGATIEDVKINAEGAFAGLFNPPGQAGGSYNVEIIGGLYAVYMEKVKGRQQAKFIIMSGCTFRNQERAVFNIELYHPMVVVGFHIVKDKGAINIGMPHDGLSLIDGVVELNGGKMIENSDRSIYLRNIYLKGADYVTDEFEIEDPDNWLKIDEYSYCSNMNSMNIIDGEINTGNLKQFSETDIASGEELADILIRKHVWDNQRYPHFKTPEVVNIKDSIQMKGNHAIGDGLNDDTKALEYALANFDKIFLPKGTYITSKTLKLRSNTRLFGVSRAHTSLTASPEWQSGPGAPLIETVDDSEAQTTLAFLSARSRSHPLVWKAGRNSALRGVSAGEVFIKGNGGGKWIAFMNVGSQLHIEETKQALVMYATNPERARDPEWEILNSENVTLYYVKTEAGTDGHSIMTSLRIKDSKNIKIFGSTGNVQLNGSDGMGMIEVIDSEDIIVTHANPFKQGTNWYTFKEIYNGRETGIPSTSKLAVYKRGNPE